MSNFSTNAGKRSVAGRLQLRPRQRTPPEFGQDALQLTHHVDPTGATYEEGA
jgi:hypothetical protein